VCCQLAALRVGAHTAGGVTRPPGQLLGWKCCQRCFCQVSVLRLEVSALDRSTTGHTSSPTAGLVVGSQRVRRRVPLSRPQLCTLWWRAQRPLLRAHLTPGTITPLLSTPTSTAFHPLRYGEDVSVLEMDGQFDKLEELIYVESHLSNTSAKFYGEITQQARCVGAGGAWVLSSPRTHRKAVSIGRRCVCVPCSTPSDNVCVCTAGPVTHSRLTPSADAQEQLLPRQQQRHRPAAGARRVLSGGWVRCAEGRGRASSTSRR
jgi:hypothetical protein